MKKLIFFKYGLTALMMVVCVTMMAQNKTATVNSRNNQINTINGHEYVELAGLKWATENVGEVNNVIEEDRDETYGYYYSRADAKLAAESWGDSWKLPTEAQWKKLIDECNWTWKNGYSFRGKTMNGYLVSDKKDSSKFIFLPAAGGYYDLAFALDGEGSYGCYWSTNEMYLNFRLDKRHMSQNDGELYGGMSVRPVSVDGGLYVNAQQSYRVVKSEFGHINLEDPIPNNIQGLIVGLTYEYNSDDFGEELSFYFSQENKWFTKPIVHRIAKDDGHEEFLLVAWRNVDFYFEDKSIIHANCRLLARSNLDLDGLKEDYFSIDIDKEHSPTLIKKMEKVKLKGIKVYDKKIDFLNFNSIKALEALRISAGALSGSLQINTSEGISIYVDGKYITSSGSTTQNVDYGLHTVEFRKDKYHTVTKTIDINSHTGNTITVNSLEPILGSLNITSTPAGMTVKVDGEEKGTTPLLVKDIIIGKHSVELSGTNHFTETDEAEIQESKQTVLNFEMKPFAKVSLTSNRPYANVYIDGTRMGEVPAEVDLGYGRHSIEVSKYHYRSQKKSITINSTNRQHHYFNLPLQCQQFFQVYLQPTYQCLTYDAAGLAIGFDGGLFNMEGHFLYGFDNTEDMLWIPSDPHDNSPIYRYSYKPFCYGGKLGVSFIAGTRFRFTPQLGINVNTFKGTGDGGESIASSIGLTGGLKFDFALTGWLGITVSPEYNYTIKRNSVFKALDQSSSSFSKMTDGLQLRVGLMIFWGKEE